MNEEYLTVNAVAKQTGVTIRTLHYYDQIGLLSPSEVSRSNYRLYTQSDLKTLQKILFYKEIGFQLKEIKQIIGLPIFEHREMIEKQLVILQKKREQIDNLIAYVERFLSGDKSIDFKIFDKTNLNYILDTYKQEVLERWGNTQEYQTYAKLNNNAVLGYSNKKWNMFKNKADLVFTELAEMSTLSPENSKVQEKIEQWRDLISEHFYPCSNAILKSLADIYASDKRFIGYFEQFGDKKFTSFISEAIKYFCAD